MTTMLHHIDASISVEENNDKHAISVEPKPGLFTPFKRWETNYSLELIEHVLRVKGPAYLCEEIMRDENPLYIQRDLYWNLLSYVGKEALVGKRLLDFGSGSGASSLVLARMFPETEIVGVELVADLVELAWHRAKFYGMQGRVSFRLSPDANSLPPEIGEFDYIMLSAVYEHLYPTERRLVLPLLWSRLRPGGIFFLNQTPYRWLPVEKHTTGLPLINYLPDRLAHTCARRFSKRVDRDASWPELLRKGIRGGTAREVLTILNRYENKARLLEPSRLAKDRIDLWYKLASSARNPLINKAMMWGLRLVKATTGITMTPMLSLAIGKVH